MDRFEEFKKESLDLLERVAEKHSSWVSNDLTSSLHDEKAKMFEQDDKMLREKVGLGFALLVEEAVNKCVETAYPHAVKRLDKEIKRAQEHYDSLLAKYNESSAIEDEVDTLKIKAKKLKKRVLRIQEAIALLKKCRIKIPESILKEVEESTEERMTLLSRLNELESNMVTSFNVDEAKCVLERLKERKNRSPAVIVMEFESRNFKIMMDRYDDLIEFGKVIVEKYNKIPFRDLPNRHYHRDNRHCLNRSLTLFFREDIQGLSIVPNNKVSKMRYTYTYVLEVKEYYKMNGGGASYTQSHWL